MGLSAIFAAYRSELDRRDWLHPAQVPLAAAEAVKAGAALPRVVVLDGFQVFRGVELALLQAVAERAEVLATFDPESGARAQYDYERLLESLPNTHVIELKGRTGVPCYGDLREPPRTARTSCEPWPGRSSSASRRTRLSVPRTAPWRSDRCRHTWALPDRCSPSTTCLSIPPLGERLNTRPLGVWLRRLLHLARDGWRLRDLAAVLSSGFIDLGRWRLSPDDVTRFTRRGRKNNLWAGQDALGRIADGLRADAGESQYGPTREMGRRVAEGMASALQDLRGLLEQPPSAVGEHARRLDDALFGSRPLVQPSSRKLPGVDVEVDALRGYLRDIAATDEALGGGPEPFDSFAARLERKLDAPAVLLREAGGVLLAPMHTLHGLRFDFVALGGLVQGEFPAQRTGTTLLDSDAREALNGAGLALPPEPHVAEDDLWSSASTRADGSLAFWRTRLDDRGRPANPSYYFDRLPHDRTIDADGQPFPEITSVEGHYGEPLFPGESVSWEMMVPVRELRSGTFRMEGNLSRRHLFRREQVLEVGTSTE